MLEQAVQRVHRAVVFSLGLLLLLARVDSGLSFIDFVATFVARSSAA
ncbi:hypothetical protein [Pseudomonas sp. R4-35-07]|nr:hypothetical protein [Pseudomonas sp. R4-35-07]